MKLLPTIAAVASAYEQPKYNDFLDSLSQKSSGWGHPTDKVAALFSLCPSLTEPDNASVVCDQSTCALVCNEGFVATGRRRTKCRFNNANGFFWKRQLGGCDTCADLAAPPAGVEIDATLNDAAQNTFESGEFTVTTTSIFNHPGYGDTADGSGSNMDICLMKFNDNLVTGRTGTAPVCLSTSYPDHGKACWVAGWGTTSEGGNTANLLQSVGVNILGQDYCNANTNNSPLLPDDICAGLPDVDGNGLTDAGIDSCQGDSGGPLVCDVNGAATLVGVVSRDNNGGLLAEVDATLNDAAKDTIEAGEFQVTSTTMFNHPGYGDTADGSGSNMDICLIKFNDNLVTGRTGTAPVCLSTAYPDHGKACWVAGWGALSSGGSSPNLLQSVGVNILGQEYCSANSNNGALLPDDICAGLPDLDGNGLTDPGVDSCQGDSGGPLVCNVNGAATLVGVVSRGVGCADEGHPGIYTAIHTDTWVADTIAANP
ncbi:Oidioi.mRNA.OKI2018_I69.chr2.g4632.t1.cds [Oikopleura dioica]|uniref:Oidioi.mRNA.OKI2018_I69.chr2.g4632.t1.cds n=1 Tax=Oikopleura dioica TaxID=34765 RepID=A0ABN7SXN6_OIKDI|nr:Oidioi.mRNA.OKI2018_I69.chr2.g4632.t1.cds [Oikopleura dioica]